MAQATTTPESPAKRPMLEQSAAPRTRRGFWTTTLRAVPNTIAFALLAGVFYLGHRTDWKPRKLSQWLAPAAEPNDDWCAEHLVAASQCVECNEELLPKQPQFGFCRRHGVAECVIDHPELAQIDGPPRLPKYDAAAALALVARRANNSKNTLHRKRIQFASEAGAAKFGIDVDVVQERPMADTVTANGELTFDPTRVAHLSSRAAGTVAAVLKTIGDEVVTGDVLALVDAVDVGEAKTRLLKCLVERRLRRSTAERLRGLARDKLVAAKEGAVAEAALQEAEIALLSARQALLNLGFDVPEETDDVDAGQFEEQLRFLDVPTSCLAALPRAARSTNLIPIRARYDGVVLSSDAVAGEVVDTRKELFMVADPRRLWLLLNVRQEDARYVSKGLHVRFQADDGSQQVAGKIAWISPAVDGRTRTLQVRVVLSNADGRLRGRTFGTATIILREEPDAVVVPVEALQATTDAQFVFVRDKDYLKEGGFKLFHVRQVRTGARDGQYVELLAGVLPGEVVATQGSAALLAQLLRNHLGPGCDCCN